MGPEIAFWPTDSASFVSTWTVYLHATTVHSNVIGQYYSHYEQKPERFRFQKSHRCPFIEINYNKNLKDSFKIIKKMK